METEELGTKIAADLIERYVGKTISQVGKTAKATSEEISVVLNQCFKPYIASQYDVYSTTKVIVSPLKPIKVVDVFEPPEISINSERNRYPSKRGMNFKDFRALLRDKARIIITAIAGSGKSMFLKYLFLEMCHNSRDHIPIFIELRALNELSKKDVLSYLFAQISAANSKFSRAQLDSALQKGKFCFLFDGFDELHPDIRIDIKKQIDELAYKYSRNPILLTSRPDDAFISWSQYTEYYLHPYRREQVLQLVKKMPFDSRVKDKFVGRIRDDLYSTHKDFLSNPLLASMMLLTFESSYDIPKKRHIFYHRAFQALIEKHDASKGYKRAFKSGLDQDDFERVFAGYCIYSYLDRDFTFSQDGAEEYAELAYRVSSIPAQASEFVSDLVNCVCMLVRDGDRLSFVHRSFQEYFSACFAVRYSEDKGARILENFFTRDVTLLPREAADLAYEISPDYVDFSYVLPALEKFVAEYSSVQDDHSAKFSMFFSHVAQERSDGKTIYTAYPKKSSEGSQYLTLFMFLSRMDHFALTSVFSDQSWAFVMGSNGETRINGSRHVKNVINKMCKSLLNVHARISERKRSKEDMLRMLN